jgi:glutathione peroxidase
MSFYDLKTHAPNGDKIKMKDFKGKAVLVVNTATQCGLTPQFEGLENLHQKYKEKGLEILGFPCNQFMGQEPLSNKEMESICKTNHGVTFQLTEKVDVNGSNTNEVFKFLKSKKGGLLGSAIKWNFTKFLIDKNGHVVKRYAPTTLPEKIEVDIKKAL